MKSRWPVLALVLVLAGCEATDTDGTPTSCTRDFECAVGEVCGVDAVCAAAAGGAEREFGEVALDFSAGNEEYLLAVYALPRGAEAGNEPEASFAITPAESATLGALRVGGAAPAVDPSWAARLAYESGRHAALDALIDDVYAGRRVVRGASLRQASGCAEDCGATQMCWQGACADALELAFVERDNTLSMVVAGVVDAGTFDINVLIEDGGDAGAAIDAAEELASTLADELALLGLTSHDGALDRDGDGRLTVAFTDSEVGGVTLDVVGLFDLNDFLPATDGAATGNEADILWARSIGGTNAGGEITEDLAVGTLVHEYVHLASYAKRVYERPSAPARETLWLDEGLAHLMEDLTGWGGSNVGVVSVALSEWDTTVFAGTDDTLAQRGKAMMLLRHLADSGVGASALVSGLLAEDAQGFEHDAFADGAGTVWRWQLASYATGNDTVSVSAAHAYDYDATSTSDAGYIVGIDPYATYPDARGEDVILEGPTVTDVLDPATSSELSDGSIPISGTYLYLVSGGTGTVTLVGKADAQVSLHMAAQRVR